MKRLLAIFILLPTVLFAQAVVVKHKVVTPTAATPTFADQTGTYAGVPQILISSSTSGSSAYIVYNTTGAQSGGNLTGTTTGTSVGITATTTIYAQVQGLPGYNNSAIATSSQYIVYGLTTVGGTAGSLTTGSAYASQITTATHAAGFTLHFHSVYAQRTSTSGNLVTAIYTGGTGSQTVVIDGSGYPVAYNGTAQWVTAAYGGTLASNTVYGLAVQASTGLNVWYGSSGLAYMYAASCCTYPTWPSPHSWTSLGSHIQSEYIVVTAN